MAREPVLAEAILSIAGDAPGRTALVAGERRLDYGELRERATALARGLRAAGLGPGERVVVVAQNSPEYLVGALATWLAGGVYATVYPASGPSELEYVLTNARPRLVLAERERIDGVAAAMAATGCEAGLHVLADGGPEGLPAPAGEEPLEPVDADSPALICYTSGSTARPKPVVHSHAGLVSAARAYAKVLRVGEHDRALVCLPMAWVYGLVSTSMATLVSGGAVVVLPRYNPVQVVEAIEAEQVTFLPGVTTMYVKLVDYVATLARRPSLRSLRLCISGGEPRNEPVFERWREITGCPVHDVYCASECFPVVAYDPERDPRPRPGSAGRVVPEAEMRVVDETGADVAPGEVGEALWRGPALMAGYWEEPELTRSAFTEDGWYRSRDYTRIDDEGYVYVTGRVSDMIIRGGSNVSPAEVEAVLSEHPDVADVAVVGLPDPEYGERVAAALVLRPDRRLDERELARLCESRLAPFKVPTLYRELPEIPRNANGKIMRRDVAPLLQDDRITAG